jgi:hypothetical protein
MLDSTHSPPFIAIRWKRRGWILPAFGWSCDEKDQHSRQACFRTESGEFFRIPRMSLAFNITRLTFI